MHSHRADFSVFTTWAIAMTSEYSPYLPWRWGKHFKGKEEILQALEKEMERKAVRSQVHLALRSCCPLALCVMLIGQLSCVFIPMRFCYLVAKVYYLK